MVVDPPWLSSVRHASFTEAFVKRHVPRQGAALRHPKVSMGAPWQRHCTVSDLDDEQQLMARTRFTFL